MIHQVYKVWDTEFHGIECLTDGVELGFEGCYGENINHPDPRPGHAIWISKLHAEKLFRLFNSQESKRKGKGNAYPNLAEQVETPDTRKGLEDKK
jgi:hypothetical protein